tara:strand:- start:9425 stop:9817 length:393 start_codon:yes stop_codon:yes gene_type:complete
MGVVVTKSFTREPFYAALIRRYGLDKLDSTFDDIECKFRFYGWRQSSNAIARVGSLSKIGVGSDTIILRVTKPFDIVFPTLAIPKKDLSYVGTEFVWSAVSKFDVFNVQNSEEVQLLLPVGYSSKVEKVD